jgi:hypothetical protein
MKSHHLVAPIFSPMCCYGWGRFASETVRYTHCRFAQMKLCLSAFAAIISGKLWRVCLTWSPVSDIYISYFSKCSVK